MNEGRPYLRTWRDMWVYFCKIAIVPFLSVRYKSDGLYRRMARTPSSPTLFSTPSVRKYLSPKWIKIDVSKTKIRPDTFPFIHFDDKYFRTEGVENRVGDDGVRAILQYRPSDLYLTDRKETMAILQKYTHTSLHVRK